MKLKIFQNNSLIEFLQGHKIKNSSGTALTQRGSIKFTGSATVTDDSTNDQTIVNITGGGSGGHTILDSSGTAMNQRGKLQFVGADVTDDSTNGKTIVKTTPQSMIGDAWVSGHAYAVGDYAIDANGLYKNGTAHTSNATNRPSVNQSGYWTAKSVTSELGRDVLLYEKKLQYKTAAPNTYTETVNIDVSGYSRVVVYDARRAGSANGGYDYFGELEIPVDKIDNTTVIYKQLANAQSWTTITISSSKKIANITLNGGVASDTLYWTDLMIYGYR